MTSPPSGYIAVESAVPGIELYKPAPEDTGGPHQPVVTFNCPQCDATTGFSAADGGLTCSYCGFYEPPKKAIVGKGAEEFGFTIETVERAAHGWGVERTDLHCQRCGAHTVIPPNTLTHTCPFCGSNNVIQQKAPQDALRPRFLIPFKFEGEACHKIAREWLGNNWMTPDPLKRLALLSDFVPVFIPFWTFDARANAAWRGEVLQPENGEESNKGLRELTRTNQWRGEPEAINRYFDKIAALGNTRLSKQSTTAEWKWESGVVHRFFDDLVVSGTTRLSKRLLSQIQRYDLNDLLEYEPKLLAGQQAQAYDLPLDEAWQLARHQMREQIRLDCRFQASTLITRNFSMKLDFNDESWRYILVPVYIAVYRFRGQRFQVMINGQSGTISGQRPVDWIKVWLVIAAGMVPALLLTLLSILFQMTGHESASWYILAFIVALVSIGAATEVIRKARAMDDV